MLRGLLQQPIGSPDYSSFYHDQVGNQLRGRPGSVSWAGHPLIRRDGIGGAQQALLSDDQFLEDGFESRHEKFLLTHPTETALFLCAALRPDSDAGAARLFKSVGQLQDAGFAEGRAKDLQADGELTADLS